MNPLLNYGIQVIIVSGLLYSYYHFVLRNKKFHRYNRFYLLGAAVLSVLIPLLNIPVYFSEADTESSIVYNTLRVFATTETDEAVTIYAGIPEKESWFTLTHIFQLVYFTIAIVVLLRVIFSLMKIRRIIRQHPVEKIENISFLNTDEPGTPFSFFRWLFWNRKIELNSEKGEQIFRHELFHIEQKHSLDIIFLELLTVAGWFNPFFHLMKRETKAIHEFLADQFAVTENNRWDYAELLLMQVLNTNQRLVHPFFHNQIKRRIAMITSPQKTSHQYLRKLMVLPVTAVAVILFAFNYKNSNYNLPETESGEKQTIIIDVSHGGNDPGAIGADGTKEKDLVLAIAQKIRSLNQNGNYNIVLTRDGDFLPELKSRVSTGNDQAPALFISLHINSSPDKQKNGIEVYIPKNENKHFKESKAFGSILIGKLSENYEAGPNILQRSQTIWVLENSNCPATLVEIGYITNEKDLYHIRNTNNQENIAKKILEAIYGYNIQDQDKKVNYSSSITNDTTIKPTRKMATFDQMVIVSDSIILKSFPSKALKDKKPEAIVFMNGKRIPKSEFVNKTILCDSFEYYDAGDKKAIELYGPEAKDGVMIIHNGKITDTEFELKEANKPEEDKIFSKVEIEASFPGGSSAWRRYMERNLDASIPEKQKAPAGNYTVVIQFVVNLDGTVSDVRALTNHGYGMETEAIRAIKKGPKWLPAIQNGRKIVAYRKQPITFVVDNGPKKESKLNAGQGTELNEVVVVGYSDPSIPTFPGGDSAWKKYLIVNANSMVSVNNGAPEGRYKTRIRFIVHPDGTLSDITALTHFGYGMEEEAIRLIKNGPRWIPATRDGTKVSSYREQPITFELTSEPDKPNYPPVIPSIKLTNITSPRLANGNLLKLDPGTIYIGLTNTILLETSGNDMKFITAETGNGNMLKIENGKIEIQTNAVQDQFAIKLFYTKDNIKTTVKTVNFPVRLIPQQ
ncbi:MAG TPA: N-acetylmuramoyl-L-alanine amidase [Chitinophagaceae bacterium]|nr:N-acetylmuramoyl-L-alanine amidase [Chitinophagaceae bacterium]HPN58573.1 N-acetylmuramoyl-L-alanine amidase [Chitinophagaceae bacterium]